MAVAVLAYANRAKVAEALTAGGYPVSRVTVNRWAKGAEMPAIASRMVLELFGHGSPTSSTVEPPWATRLDDRLRSLEERLANVTEEDLSRRVAQRVEETLRELGAQPGSDAQPRASDRSA